MRPTDGHDELKVVRDGFNTHLRVGVVFLLSVMAAHASFVGPGIGRHNCGRAHGIAQANQTIGHAGNAIELLDLGFQVAQLVQGTLQARDGADQADIVPHDVLNGAHILADESRIWRLGTGRLPGWDVGWIGNRSLCQCGLDALCRPVSPHEAL